jgi:CheY-like chemotaxis protein
MLALVVTPNPLLCTSMAYMLNALGGMAVVTAASGAEARALIAECGPDLILAAGWLAEGELVPLLVDAARLAPGGLRVALEATREEQAALEEAAVDLVLVEGEPAARLVDELARLLPKLQARATVIPASGE